MSKPYTMSIDEIKSKVDIIDVASSFCELIKEGGDKFKAKINPLRDEKTSSLYFYANTQRYYDYGDGSNGDVIDFTAKILTIVAHEAILKVKEFGEGSACFLDCKKITYQAHHDTKLSSTSLLEEWNRFEVLDFNNALHQKELFAVATSWLYVQASKESLKEFHYFAKYDPYYKTIVIRIDDALSGEIKGYKYRRREMNGENKKWVSRKDTCSKGFFVRIMNDAPQESIFILEGTHDMLTALLCGISFVSAISASTQNFDATTLGLLRGGKIRFLPHIDEVGKKMAKTLSVQIDSKTIAIRDIRRLLVDCEIQSEHLDFSDVLTAFGTVTPDLKQFITRLKEL